MRNIMVLRALGFFALLAAANPAAALATHTFVSATGSDSNACTQTLPCLTFQRAVNVTAAGGMIDALTSGDFGSFVVNNSLTINGHGLATIQETSGQAVAVNEYATTDVVILRGLTINGGGTGVEGVYYPGGGELVVDDCTISGFTYDGIVNVTNGNSVLIVRNTTIVGGATGIYVNEDGGMTTLEHVIISGISTYGIEVLNSPGNLVINDSVINGGVYGVDIQSSAYYGAAAFAAMLERSTITNASTAGVYVGVGATNIDSTNFLFDGFPVEAQSGGVIRLSNNNVYNNNGPFASCVGGTIYTASNNRRAQNNESGEGGGCTTFTPITTQ
jgi:hypothetical protein